jgi:hypothetical protein
VAVNDHAVRQVVRRQRYSDPVAQDHADAVLAHAAAELGTHDGACVGLDLELTAGEDLRNYAIELYMVIASQEVPLAGRSPKLGLRRP